MTKKLIIKNLPVLLIIGLLLLTSCRNKAVAHAEVERAAQIFFITILQCVNLAILGITGLVLGIIGYSNNKNGLRVASLIILSVFTLFTLMSFVGVMNRHAKFFMIFIIFGLEFIVIGIGFFVNLRARKTIDPTKSESSNVTDDEYLDNIINEEEEIV